MTIVVVGATGLIGAKLAHILTANGQQVLAASRSTGVDVLTGEGVSDALRGAEAVIDVTDSPSYEDDAPLEFFTTSTANLVTAERAAGVAHHVALSVVGADRMPDSGYMRAKVAQEAGIVGSGVAYTVLRATQFFEFACGIADSCTDGNTIRVPDALIQPIAATEVAARLAAIGAGAPANAIVELGGPECLSFEHFIRAALTRYGDTRTVSTDPHARYFGTALEPRTLVAADTAARGRLRLANWLAGR
ncbi:NAD(P)H-binding protein [Mycobacterium malmoense]|uniref:NmrA family transcriptional regulator n=1 Tax=Mycobacterium malmoense TaxID=1780 RepID=A0ABX3SUA5_MYCMA|nr:NAD(P)H-binding protein [Mycobacterium malmoense]ORA82770.1 NmrA family transcriptional regulator [Mycobacterium malmoense]QZA19005.1 NAD(P)H-binding protein [Mycobacterium malmoense]UNB95772.1 NAD(P)H-binding protein [Mycobacterium malmoense]